VKVDVGVSVGVDVNVEVDVGVKVGVDVNVEVAVGVGVDVDVGFIVGVKVDDGVGPDVGFAQFSSSALQNSLETPYDPRPINIDIHFQPHLGTL
jgi:hypothetical protein